MRGLSIEQILATKFPRPRLQGAFRSFACAGVRKANGARTPAVRGGDPFSAPCQAHRHLSFHLHCCCRWAPSPRRRGSRQIGRIGATSPSFPSMSRRAERTFRFRSGWRPRINAATSSGTFSRRM